MRAAARTYEEQLDNGEQAYHTLYIAWTEDFGNKNTAVDLERVTVANEKWNELLTSANQVLQEGHEPETQIAICLCCAKWYGQDLGHPEYAIPYYEQIRALDPSNAKAWWQLGDLYETTQQWDKLAQALAKLVELTSDDEVKANTYVRMGDLADDRFAMRQEAEDYYRRALHLQDTHVGALAALERIYREDGRSNKLLNILERKAQAVEDTDMRRVGTAAGRRSLRGDASTTRRRRSRTTRRRLSCRPQTSVRFEVWSACTRKRAAIRI